MDPAGVCSEQNVESPISSVHGPAVVAEIQSPKQPKSPVSLPPVLLVGFFGEFQVSGGFDAL